MKSSLTSPPLSFAGAPPEMPRVAMPDEPPSRPDFATLYRNTVAPLRRYLTRLLGNSAEAQDVAHDAYIRVYPQADDPKILQPEAVLYTTARRLAINRLKRRSISPISNETSNYDTAASATPGVAQQVMARQELQLLEAAIAQLPAGCRNVLLLRKVELLSHREIADRLGISISTVEKQHVRALRLLRAALPTDTMRSTHASTGDHPEAKASS